MAQTGRSRRRDYDDIKILLVTDGMTDEEIQDRWSKVVQILESVDVLLLGDTFDSHPIADGIEPSGAEGAIDCTELI